MSEPKPPEQGARGFAALPLDPADEGSAATSTRGAPRRWRLDRMERAVLLTATAAAAAYAVASTFGGQEDSRSWTLLVPAWLTVVVAGIGAAVGRNAILPVALIALPLTVVPGRWTSGSVAEGLLLVTTLMWSVALVMFVQRSRVVVAAGVVLAAGTAPLWWHGAAGLVEAIGDSLVTVLVVGLVVMARSEMEHATQTVQAVFENAPVGIMEQNWSTTLHELRKLRRAGIVDLVQYLRANPSEVGRLFSTAQILSRNAQAARVFPAPQDDGHHSPETIDQTSFEGAIALINDFFEGRFIRRVLFSMPDDDGEIHWHHITSFPHPGHNGEFIVVSTDITGIKKAEEALEQLVASKDRFVAAISHELRTPLAAVVGFTSELLERSESITPEERHEFLSLAHEQALEAANIIADLLVVARADIGEVVVTHDEVDVEAEIEHLLSANCWDVDVSTSVTLPTVCGDSGRVRQVLRNLLTNAARYGGPVERIICSARGDSVSIQVRDNGLELSTVQMEELFEPYTRAHESAGITESVGLGLTVARHLAILMGGALVGYRDDGETVFELTLPIAGRCPVKDGDRTARTSPG